MQTTSTQSQRLAIRDPESTIRTPTPWLQDFWLWILLAGPLVAPLFLWIGWPILRPFADAIYLLGETVCPKVDVHLMFLDNPMAVCSSCWASVFGLWTMRLLYGRAGEGLGIFSRLGLSSHWNRWQSTPPTLKLIVLAAGFLPWAFDVITWDLGAWSSPQPYMMFAGYLGGLAAGALILPAASQMRARLSHSQQ